MNVRNRARDLARDECATTARALVVEENTVAGIHSVRLAIINRDPKAIELRNTVWRTGVERRGLGLWALDDLPVELGSGRLVESHNTSEAARPDGIQEAQRPEAIDIASVLGHLEGDLDVRLSTKVVQLRRAYLADDVHEVGAVRQIAIVQHEFCFGYRNQ